MTQIEMFPTATSSPQDTPVNLSRWPEKEVVAQIIATSGRTFFPLLKPNDPIGAFSRTFLGICQWGSMRCLLTWKANLATPQGRFVFQLQASTLRTKETGSGLLHTPTATANQMSPSMNSGYWPTPDANCGARGTQEDYTKIRPSGQPAQYTINQAVRDNPQMWPTPTSSTGGPSKNPNNPRGKHGGNPLATSVAMWPTPTVQDSNKATKKWREDHQNNLTAAVFNPEKMWATPAARDWKGPTITENHPKGFNKSLPNEVKLWPTPAAANSKGAVKNRFMGSPTYKGNLDEAVRTKKESGQLNPNWVEWLMGYPRGWTDLTDGK